MVASHLEILMVAGEASGDLHGGSLIRELSSRLPEARFFGMGGPRMREAGLEALYDSKEISVMGAVEVLPKILRILSVLKGLHQSAIQRRPRLAILIDVPDFNLRLARRLKRQGIPVVYYISPMIWASRASRVKQIRRNVDLMLCILPFEEHLYRQHGVQAIYVGNPLLDQIPSPASVSEFRTRLNLPEKPTLALLPGSRESEITRLMPTLVMVAEQLKAVYSDLQVIIPVAPSIDHKRISAYFWQRTVSPTIVTARTAEVIGASDGAIVCSGTATLEAGLMLRPFVVVYRMPLITFLLFKLFIRVAHLSLVNILANRRIVPELLQFDCTPAKITHAVLPFFKQHTQNNVLIEQLTSVRASLGSAGASTNAAKAVISLLRKKEPESGTRET